MNDHFLLIYIYIFASLNSNAVNCNNTDVLQNRESIQIYTNKKATSRTRY